MKGLIDKYLGEGDYKDNPLDAWLDKNGWKETHGIALYTHPKYPLIGVDTNSGNAAVDVFDSPRQVFNDEGSMQGYVTKPKDLEKAVNRGILVSEIWKAVNKRKGYKKSIMSSSGISLYADIGGYGVHIYFDQPKLVMTLGGYNVKGEDKNRESIYADNYKADFPYKKSSIKPIVKQIAQWEKEQWT